MVVGYIDAGEGVEGGFTGTDSIEGEVVGVAIVVAAEGNAVPVTTVLGAAEKNVG